jgi:four helix bundle protein
MIESFRDLNVWKKAMDFAVNVYSQTEGLPAAERFGLISQIRRAAVSIPSNIAEGKAVGGQRYRRHLKYALGSEAELHTQIELARRLNMLSEVSTRDLLQDLATLGRMVTALLKALPRD